MKTCIFTQNNVILEAICSSISPAFSNLANIISVFKVGSRNQKDNYSPIILLIIRKIFEKLISQHLPSHFDNIFSKFKCGFQKDSGSSHYLLLVIEKLEKAVGNKKNFGFLLTDLSRSSDCISHNLLIAKLHAHGLSFPALKLMQDYVQNCKYKTNVETTYSN